MKNIVIVLQLIVLFFSTIQSWSQNLEVEGEVKIGSMTKNNHADSVVVRLADGTLAILERDSLVEYQYLSISEDTVFLTNGGFVVLPPEQDGDSTNEIQHLLLDGDTLRISKGNAIVIPGIRCLNPNLNAQELLDCGNHPCDLLKNHGLPLDSLYGRFYQGGLIFYLDTTSCIGLVSADAPDQSSGIYWGNFGHSGAVVGADGTGICDGRANTDSIVAYESGYLSAGVLCDTLTINGFLDWYLPSNGEWAFMWENLYTKGYGGFQFLGNYWTSTEISFDRAFSVLVTDGGGLESEDLKSANQFRVRAIRKF